MAFLNSFFFNEFEFVVEAGESNHSISISICQLLPKPSLIVFFVFFVCLIVVLFQIPVISTQVHYTQTENT